MAKINWGDVGAFGAGALDELLLGAPEWLLKNLGNRKAVEDYIKANEKAYKSGEVAGTVGGAFIPFGAAGKALKAGAMGAKALKAADVGTDIVRAADTGLDLAKGAKIAAGAADIGAAAKKASLAKELLSAAGKGAKWGGAEAAARGVFDEETPEEIARDVQQGIMFGGLGGAGGKLVSKKLSPALDKLQEMTAQKYLAGRGFSARDLKKAFTESMPKGAKENYKVQKAGQYLREVADFTKKIPRQEGAVEALASKTDELYGKLDDAWKAAYGPIEAPKVLEAITNNIDMSEIAQNYGDEAAEAAKQYLIGQAAGKGGLVQMKKFLQNQFDLARTSPKISENYALSGAIQDMASKIKGSLDDIAVKLAEQQGLGKIDVEELGKTYRLSKPLKLADIRETLSTPRSGGGSPTFDKQAASALIAQLGIGGAIGGGTGMADRLGIDTGNSALNAMLSSVIGAGSAKGLSKLSTRALGALDTPIAKLAAKATPEAIEAAAPALTVAGARGAANIANVAAESTEPTTPEEADAAQAGAEIGAATDQKQYSSLVLSRLQQFAAAEGISADSPDFAEFVQYVGQSTMGDDGPFDAAKLAPMLFPDADARAKFTQALSVSRKLSASLPGAMKTAPLLGIGESTEDSIARQGALDQLSALVGEVAKERGTEKAAKKQLNEILKSRMPQREKERLIRGLLENYGIDFETLAQVGLA